MKNKKSTCKIDVQFMNFNKVNRFTAWNPKHSFDHELNKIVDSYEKFLRK